MRLANWPSGLQHINRPKYRNIPRVVDGKRFDSKLEANRYEQLKLLQLAGEVKWFIRQPRFELAGGITYIADYLVHWDNLNVTVEDVKGMETKDFKLKKKLMAEAYPNVDLRILTKADIR